MITAPEHERTPVAINRGGAPYRRVLLTLPTSTPRCTEGWFELTFASNRPRGGRTSSSRHAARSMRWACMAGEPMMSGADVPSGSANAAWGGAPFVAIPLQVNGSPLCLTVAVARGLTTVIPPPIFHAVAFLQKMAPQPSSIDLTATTASAAAGAVTFGGPLGGIGLRMMAASSEPPHASTRGKINKTMMGIIHRRVD